MKVTLSTENNKNVLVLPVITPDSVKINWGDSRNEVFDTLDGDVTALGTRPLISVDIKSFFPSKKASYMAAGSKAEPINNSKWIHEQRDKKRVFRVVITNGKGKTILNRSMTLESFETEPMDAAGDYPYSMSFTQYKGGK